MELMEIEVVNEGTQSPSTEENICCICYERLEAKPSKSIDCGHKYHTECIDHWIILRTVQIREPNCPLCKATIDASEMDLLPLALDLGADIHNQLRNAQNVQNSIFVKLLGYPSLHGYKYLFLMIYFIAMMSIDLRKQEIISLLLFFTLMLHIWQSTLFIRYYTVFTTPDINNASHNSITLCISYILIILIIAKFIGIFEFMPISSLSGPLVICLLCDIVAVVFSLIYIIDIHSRSCRNDEPNDNENDNENNEN